MPFEYNKEVTELFKDRDSVKILATTDKLGRPHIVIDKTITLNEEGNLLYLEFLETSQCNSNLVNSLWFKKIVTVHVKKEDTEYEIQGVPQYSIISGPIFEQYYRNALAEDETADLSTVWVIKPIKIINESPAYKKEQEKKDHPLVMHLDHLAK